MLLIKEYGMHIWTELETTTVLLVTTSCYILLAVPTFKASPLWISVSGRPEALGLTRRCTARCLAPLSVRPPEEWCHTITAHRSVAEEQKGSWTGVFVVVECRLSMSGPAGWRRRRWAPVSGPVCPRVLPCPGAVGHWPRSARRQDYPAKKHFWDIYIIISTWNQTIGFEIQKLLQNRCSKIKAEIFIEAFPLIWLFKTLLYFCFLFSFINLFFLDICY